MAVPKQNLITTPAPLAPGGTQALTRALAAPGAGSRVQQVNVQQAQNPMAQLVSSLAQADAVRQGALMQGQGRQMMYTPAGKDFDSPRNMLAGSIRAHRGRKKFAEGVAMEREQQAAALAKQESNLEAMKNMAIQAGMDPDMAEAFASAKAAGMDIKLTDFIEDPEGSEEMQKRAERGEFLKKNPEIVDRVGQDAADKFWMTGNWDSGKGMSLTMTPDGMITFSDGGEPLVMEPTTGTDTGQQETLLNAEDTKDTLEYIMSAGGPDFLGYGPRLKAWAGGQLDKLGLSDTDMAEFAAERSAWANQILQRVMEYRKHITGVAGGPAEMKKIEAIIANPRMGAAEFEQTIKEEIKSAQRDANLVRESRGLDPVDWPEFEFKWGREEEGIEVAPGVTVRRKGG